MSAPSAPEAWLRGPLPGIDPVLMPAAHALVQARDDLAAALAGAETDDLWSRPGGAASAGFHLRHLAGSIDRLFTYARGERLSPGQLAALAREGEPGAGAEELDRIAGAAIDRALEQLRRTPVATLGEIRPSDAQGSRRPYSACWCMRPSTARATPASSSLRSRSSAGSGRQPRHSRCTRKSVDTHARNAA